MSNYDRMGTVQTVRDKKTRVERAITEREENK